MGRGPIRRLVGVVHHHIIRLDVIVEVELNLFDDALEIGPVNVAPVRREHLKELHHLLQRSK